MRSLTNFAVTKPVEQFTPKVQKYGEVSLIDAYDSFTHNLVQAFLKLGASVKVFRSKETSVSEVEKNIGSYLVLSPGPGVPNDAGILKEAINKFKDQIPILGVCLGMQAINEVFGGVTTPAPEIIHGKSSKINHDGNGIFQNIKSPVKVARYHSLQISKTPKELVIQSMHGTIPMAFHIPGKIAGVQFHPESFLTEFGSLMLENFLEGKI